MSLAAVTDLSNELRRLAIAGASLAPGDHRVAKLIPPLRKSGAKVPIFDKIAQAAEALVDSDRKTASTALLRVNSLVMAVIKTQGKSSVEGTITSLNKASLTGNQPISARILEDVKNALVIGGQGRMETITNAYERGFFGDIRLAEAAIKALSDNSHEVANLAADKLIPPYGPGVASILAEQFDPTAKKPGARLLTALAGCDPESGAMLGRIVLEGGEDFERRFRLEEKTEPSMEVRAASLECLSDSDEDTGLLLDHLKAKNKALRISALRRLIAHGHPDAEAIVLEKLEGSASKIREAIESLDSIRSPAILKAVKKQVRDYFDGLKKLSLVEANTLVQLLTAVARSKPDKTTLPLGLEAMDNLNHLEKRFAKESYSARDNLFRLERLLIRFLTDSGSPKAFDSIAAQFSSGVQYPEHAMAALFTLASPDKVWKKVGKTLDSKDGSKRSLAVLFQPYYQHYFTGYTLPPAEQWSKKWLQLAITNRLDSMITYLFEHDPAAIAREFLKSKKPLENVNEVVLCLASAPGKADATSKQMKLRYHYWYNQPDNPLDQLIDALKAKKSAEAKLAAEEIRAVVYDERLGDILVNAIQEHFS